MIDLVEDAFGFPSLMGAFLARGRVGSSRCANRPRRGAGSSESRVSLGDRAASDSRGKGAVGRVGRRRGSPGPGRPKITADVGFAAGKRREEE